MNSQPLIRITNVEKWFAQGVEPVPALAGIELSVEKGEFIALMGPSGSGKSTLLHLIAAMETPTSGSIDVLGRDLAAMNDREVSAWRAERVGFVFQEFNLLPVLTALENVELPLRLTSLSRPVRLERARTALNLVGLEQRYHHRPAQLSGGEQQRVAIARAIVTDPEIVLADEPTGNLNAGAAEDVLQVLKLLNAEFGKTIVMVTHDPRAVRYASRVCLLEKGVLKAWAPQPAAEAVTGAHALG